MQGTDATLTTDEFLDVFATAGNVLPRQAIRQATARWTEISPVLLAVLEDACLSSVASLSERRREILFFSIYRMAQMRETRALPPLCRLAARGGDLAVMIGDGVTEDFAAILVRIFDGHPAPLRALIEATDADEFVRDAALAALAWLTATGAIDHTETRSYFGTLFHTLKPQGESYVWVGGQQAIAALGIEELAPLVEQLFKRDWIDRSLMHVSHFREDLTLALTSDRPARDIFSGSIGDPGRSMRSNACSRPGTSSIQTDRMTRIRAATWAPGHRPSRFGIHFATWGVTTPGSAAAAGSSKNAARARQRNHERQTQADGAGAVSERPLPQPR